MIKKIVSLAMCGVLSLGCIGCASKSDYDALEQRVSALESKVGIPTDPTVYYGAFVPETSEVYESSETSNASANQNSSDFSLEGMSAEEIYAKCRYIFNVIPKTPGMTTEEYSQCLGYNDCQCNFPNFSMRGTPSNNCILNIEVTGLRKEMDGTVGCSSGNGDSGLWIKTTICMKIADYETAKAVYELMLADYKNASDTREGTCWVAEVADPQSYHCVAYMIMDGDNYSLWLTDLVV